MQLPYVIDNREHTLADVLNRLLRHDDVHALDVATAYFNIGGFDLLRESLDGLDSFRLLLGAEPGSGDDIGLQVRRDLNAAPFDEETLHLVETLIRYLRRESVLVRLYEGGFLHAKAYLSFADTVRGDRFTPVAGIVGSSNFTRAGLTSNQELNLTHKSILSPGEVEDASAAAAVRPLLQSAETSPTAQPIPQPDVPLLDTSTRQAVKSEVGARAILELLDWYDTRWGESQPYKDELIALLNESKFGDYEYTPYHIYLKTLYEYFKDELGEDGLEPAGTRSAIDLTEFQGDAVKKARRILDRYDGVMIADSVGLGKTWIGKKLLEDYAYHRRQKALVVCPASLREMWEKELREATISAEVVSQEIMGREEFDTRPYEDVDVILIDESHNFRNHLSNRYENLGRLIGGNGGRGRDGERKRLILLTATPINNTIFDLYSQIMLFAQGDRGYFSAAGIGDLRKFFLNARRQANHSHGNQMVAIFNLLEEVVVRRTRSFIRDTYPEATIGGKPIHWPKRKLRTIEYNLAKTYTGLYGDIVAGIESLHLSPYSLEDYKQTGIQRDKKKVGRGQALVGIFKSRYLKRFESSVEAFRISVRRALEFQQTFLSLLEENRLLDSTAFRESMRYLDREGEDDSARPNSRAERLNKKSEAREILDTLQELNPDLYDLSNLRKAVQHDIDILTEIWERIVEITPKCDAKLEKLKAMLSGELKGKKVLLFTYYKDTAQYVYKQLAEDEDFLAAAGHPRLARMDGDIAPGDRGGRIARFSPNANDHPDLAGSADEIDVMVSTDVLSEGQNLQDCGHLLNYDLHWNPTRMVQRAGRIDRIGSDFDTLWVYNVFPEHELEQLLGLVESLNRKIQTIDQAGLLETSVLGEIVHPRSFNTLRRIAEEDEDVFAEQESQTELVSTQFLLATLQDMLAESDLDPEALPDGIHSGREKEGYKGLFFYFTAPPAKAEGGRRHFWRYYNIDGTITDNRYEIINLIRCERDEPRLIGEADVFEIQEKVITNILASVQGQQALEAAPKILENVQQHVTTLLQSQIDNPELSRQDVRSALKALRQPLPSPYLKDLRVVYESYQRDGDVSALLEAVGELEVVEGSGRERGESKARPMERDDLHLVCWEYVWS